MYYKLNNDFVLRGWDKATSVLVCRPDNKTLGLSEDMFRSLLLCDGKTEVDNDIITDKMKKILKEFKEKGVITECDRMDPISEEQYYKYYSNRYVDSVFWSITGRCNYKCRHCYMDAPEGLCGELEHDEAIRLIDQMAECGVLRVDITGGEPFVRKDFWQLIDRIRYHKMTIGQVYTNGWLLSEGVLDEFERRELRPEFSISFDGIGWHDWMRGVAGAEAAAINALKLCRDRGFPTNVEMCIHKGNYHTLRDTVRVLADIGVGGIKTSNVAHTELWINNCEGLDLDDKEYTERMLEYIPHFYEDGMPIEVLISSVIGMRKGSTEYRVIAERYSGSEECHKRHLCGATRFSCYISPEGRLLPCMPMTACSSIQSLFPTVKNSSLKECLSDSFYMKFVDMRLKDLFAKNEKCDACQYKLKCGGGCRARAVMEGEKDLLAADCGQCMLYNEGYVERIRAVADAAIAKYCTPKQKETNE